MSRRLEFVVGCLALYTAQLMLSVHSTREPQDSGDYAAIGAFGRSALDGPQAASPPVQRSFPWDQETGERPSRKRSFDDFDMRPRASLQAPIRRHSLPARLPARAAEQEQPAQKKKRGRLHRMRRAVGRALRRAKLRLQKAWRAVKERARKVKTGIRRGAAKVYAKMPRAPWRRSRASRRASMQGGQQPPPAEGEGPQGAVGEQGPAEGEAGEGAQGISPVPPPKPPRTFAYRGPQKRSVKESAFPFPPVQGTKESGLGQLALGEGGEEEAYDVPDTGRAPPTPPELKKGGFGEAEEGGLSEASTEAPEGQEVSSSEEEMFETPPSSPSVRRRRPFSEEVAGAVVAPSIAEEAPPAAGPPGAEEEAPSAGAAGGEEEEEELEKEFESLAVPPPQAREGGASPCGMWSERISSVLQPVVNMCPDLCALWTAFSLPGRLSRSSSGMLSLAAQLASTIAVAREIVKQGRAGEPGSEKLLLGMRVGEAEDKVVRAVDETDRACWYTSVSGLFDRANEEELRLLQQASGSLGYVFKNLDSLAAKMQRLMTLAMESQPECLEAMQRELQVRRDLQTVLQEEEERTKRLGESEDAEDSTFAAHIRKLADDLRLLRLRESCSMEMIYRVEMQTVSITNFISEYTNRTRNWWKAEWLSKLARLRFPPKGAPGVPAEIAQECRSFEHGPLPTSIADVHPFVLWMWEVGNYRE
ncbi:hypothetical protein Emed_002397 [Eimeria media]